MKKKILIAVLSIMTLAACNTNPATTNEEKTQEQTTQQVKTSALFKEIVSPKTYDYYFSHTQEGVGLMGLDRNGFTPIDLSGSYFGNEMTNKVYEVNEKALNDHFEDDVKAVGAIGNILIVGSKVENETEKIGHESLMIGEDRVISVHSSRTPEIYYSDNVVYVSLLEEEMRDGITGSRQMLIKIDSEGEIVDLGDLFWIPPKGNPLFGVNNVFRMNAKDYFYNIDGIHELNNDGINKVGEFPLENNRESVISSIVTNGTDKIWSLVFNRDTELISVITLDATFKETSRFELPDADSYASYAHEIPMKYLSYRENTLKILSSIPPADSNVSQDIVYQEFSIPDQKIMTKYEHKNNSEYGNIILN